MREYIYIHVYIYVYIAHSILRIASYIVYAYDIGQAHRPATGSGRRAGRESAEWDGGGRSRSFTSWFWARAHGIDPAHVLGAGNVIDT